MGFYYYYYYAKCIVFVFFGCECIELIYLYPVSSFIYFENIFIILLMSYVN